MDKKEGAPFTTIAKQLLQALKEDLIEELLVISIPHLEVGMLKKNLLVV